VEGFPVSDTVELARNSSTATEDDFDGLMATPKPTPDDLNVEVGVGAQLPFSISYDEKRWETYRADEDPEQGPSVRQLVGMRRTDGQARALYRLLALPIRSALRTATFAPAETGEKEAEFVTDMFMLPPSAGGIHTPFERIVAQMITALFDGFSAFEQVYWIPTTGPLKGKITLKKLAYRPSQTITFLTDAHGDFAGFRQRALLHGVVKDVSIDKEDAFYYAAQEDERDFYGISYFQSAFYHYDKKVKLYYIAHLAAQRAAVGTREGIWPSGATESDKLKFKKALADLGVAQYIAHGENYKINILKEGGGFDFLSYINHHNSQMSKSVLASFFDSNQGGGSSDTALVNFGEQSDAMFILMLQSIMGEIAAAINNHLIPKFIDWNFGTAKYPEFTWGTFTDEQKEAIKSTFDKLATAGQGANVTPEFLYELEQKMADEIGLDIDYDKITAERDAQKEAEQAANDAAAAGFSSGAPGDGSGLPPAADGTATPDATAAPAAPTNNGAAALEAPLPGETTQLSAPTLDRTEVPEALAVAARALLLDALSTVPEDDEDDAGNGE
jgi:hypothetical protein